MRIWQERKEMSLFLVKKVAAHGRRGWPTEQGGEMRHDHGAGGRRDDLLRYSQNCGTTRRVRLCDRWEAP